MLPDFEGARSGTNILKIIRVMFASIIGIFVGIIGAAIWNANWGGGLQLLPLSTLFIQLLPGMLLGGFVGGYFNRTFSFLGGMMLDTEVDIEGSLEMNSIDKADGDESAKPKKKN